MKISEFKTIISGVPDDFEFEVEVEKKVSDEELNTRAHPYPFDSERCKTDKSNYDIDWSEGKMKTETKDDQIIVKHIYNSITIETDEGKQLHICLRDRGYEMKLGNGKWHLITEETDFKND